MPICMHTYRPALAEFTQETTAPAAPSAKQRRATGTVAHHPCTTWGCGSADVLMTSSSYLVTTTLALVAPVSKPRKPICSQVIYHKGVTRGRTGH